MPMTANKGEDLRWETLIMDTDREAVAAAAAVAVAVRPSKTISRQPL